MKILEKEQGKRILICENFGIFDTSVSGYRELVSPNIQIDKCIFEEVPPSADGGSVLACE
ncbi:MAG: hypothetical protein DSY76_01385 [Bacteroidetes bacterium]|nr:MAG: hypothetical protein DSY76_01385 [Bacteroidota bacterium]